MNPQEPAVLFHFTSLNSFQRIISTGMITLADIIKSNDPAEGVYSLKMMKEAFIKLRRNEEIDDTQYRRIYSILYDFHEEETAFERLQQVVLSISFCCSQYPLALWKSYGDNGRGIAIGIARKTLEQLGQEDDFEFKQVSYYTEEEMLSYYKCFWKEHLNDQVEELRLALRKEYMDGYFIKHQENAYEEEWRLVYTGVNLVDYSILGPKVPEALDAYLKSDDIVLFYKIPISKKRIIEYVLIGPQCKITTNEMNWYLTKNHIDSCNVFKDKTVMR